MRSSRRDSAGSASSAGSSSSVDDGSPPDGSSPPPSEERKTLASRKGSARTALLAANHLAAGAKDPMIADMMAMAKSVGTMKKQIKKMEQQLRDQQQTIDQLEQEKVSTGRLDAALALKAQAADVPFSPLLQARMETQP